MKSPRTENDNDLMISLGLDESTVLECHPFLSFTVFLGTSLTLVSYIFFILQPAHIQVIPPSL